MKKRMLITSIVMVVVLVVALTTSSLAWFSATQNDVTANSGSFNAAATTGSNINIAISDELGSFRSSVNFANKNTKMIPSCPTEAITNFPTTLVMNSRQVINDRFAMDYQEGPRTITFDKTDGSATDTSNDSDLYYQDALYVVNYDDVSIVENFTLKIDSSVTAASNYNPATPVMLVRLSKRGENETTWSSVGHKVLVLAEEGGYCAYDFSQLTSSGNDSKISSITTADVQSNNTGTNITPVTDSDATYKQTASLDFTGVNLAPVHGEYLKIDIVIWFDGNALTASTQQTSVQFMITVTGA